MKLHGWMIAGLLLALIGCSSAQTRGKAPDEPEPSDDILQKVNTLGDVTEVGNPVPIQISAIGLVWGLENTGAGVPHNEWRQILEDQLRKQGVAVRSCGGERRADRLQVDLTHQFADVLPLAYRRRAAADAARRLQRLEQPLGQLERGQLGLGEPQQRNPQILGRLRGALARALARALYAPIIFPVVVRSGGHVPLSAPPCGTPRRQGGGGC